MLFTDRYINDNYQFYTKEVCVSMFKVAPLSGGFMLTGMFGLLFATMFLNQYSLNWAFIVGIVSFSMFVASMISMTKAPIEDELLIDEHIADRKKRITIIKKEDKK